MSGFNVIDVTDEKYCRSSETAESYHIVEEDVTVLVSEVTDHDKVKVEMILDNRKPEADNDEESGEEMIFSITSWSSSDHHSTDW